MRVEGIYINATKATLYVSAEFDPYYNNSAENRITQGRVTKAIYVGDFDISKIKVGSEIEIYYGEPVSSKNGAYAPIKKIEVVK